MVDVDDESVNAGLEARYGVDAACAQSLRTYIAEQRASTGVVPDDQTLVIEQFRDEMGALRIILHSVFGGRVNAPWGMALAQRVREALPGMEVQVQTTDDGIMLRLPNLGGTAPLSALMHLSADEAETRVMDEVGKYVALRRALPHERGARAALAARIAAAADAALAAATQGARPTRCGAALSELPDSRRDVSRGVAGRVRHDGAEGRARLRSVRGALRFARWRRSARRRSRRACSSDS